MQTELLTTELRNHILYLTINRPSALNALNAEVLTALDQAAEAALAPEVWGVIITGAGPKAFVAGADISGFTVCPPEEAYQLARRGQQIFDKIAHLPKPVVAAVNGFALGGGCELAMACHMRVAATNAKFGQPEVNLGIIPGYGGTQRLVELVGKSKAMELTLTGDMLSAAEALALGLVNHVTEPEHLLLKAEEILQKTFAKSANAIAQAMNQ